VADPRGFLKHERQERKKRPVEERVRDFKDLYKDLPETQLKEQAVRCMDCGVPFCQSPTGCPVQNLIPEWNDWVSQGRWEEALLALHSTNNFPEFTGKLCPAPCESACVLGLTDKPVTIKDIEMSIIERGYAEGRVKPAPAFLHSGRKVAVVGSGPAGLAAAQQLARSGHEVTVFEKHDAIGGLLRYGIPDFKLEKWIIDRRLEQLSAEGVKFRTGCELGKDVTIEELRKTHDAVCLAIGAEKAREVPVPGRELPGVHLAMDYLMAQNRAVSGKAPLPEAINAKGKRVVILGGGDTGSDCLGTAHRQGCAEIHQFELLPRPPQSRDASTPWPQWPLLLRSSHAHEEGGQRDWGVMTTAFVGDAQGVRALKAVRVKPGAKGFEPVPGSEFEIPCETVLLAVGFTGPTMPITVDRDFMTQADGVFAAGDATRGASLIVWAIADARRMAAAVNRYLSKPG
jgi:glutamate synthase (NADPH) small chain